jgi:hypothetical protein
MVEWQRVENPREQLERYALDQGRRSLVRLRWGLRIAALVGLGLLEIFYVLALDRTIQEVLLDLFWGALLSLGLIQICFFVVFRLYDRAVNDQQSLATHLVRLHRLYALSRRLTASLPSDAVLRDVDEATAQAHTEALALDHREMRSALEGLVELYGAMRGSLLLLDEKGQPQEFINVGLAPDARPGPRPAQFSAENAPVTDLNSPSWC